jgi:dihydroxyacid dehydratase/phosphogluconate dehydratase
MLYATGMTDADMGKPHVGMRFNTIGVSDEIVMGTDGMSSCCSRAT